MESHLAGEPVGERASHERADEGAKFQNGGEHTLLGRRVVDIELPSAATFAKKTYSRLVAVVEVLHDLYLASPSAFLFQAGSPNTPWL